MAQNNEGVSDMYYTPKEIMRCFLSYYFKLARKSNYSMEKYKEFVWQKNLPSLREVVGRLKKQSELTIQVLLFLISLGDITADMTP